RAENGTERAELKPADIKFAIRGIVGICRDEAADVGRPIRQARKGIVEASGDLAAESFPVGVDVAGPSGCGVALCAGVSRARENKDALFVGSFALALVDGGSGVKREFVGVAGAILSAVNFVGDEEIGFAAFGFGFGSVQPPGVRANFEQGVIHEVPI